MQPVDHRFASRRDQERALVQAWNSACDECARIVTITGEAGIGKSHLVDGLARRAAEDGAVVAWGYCSPARAGRLPFGPWIDLARGVVDGVANEVVQELPGELRRSLAPLIAPWEVEGGPPTDSLAQTRLFAGFAELVRHASTAGPVLLVVEDVHWIDEASADLLVFLARSLRHHRVLLAVTARTTGARATVQSTQLLATLARERHASDVTLGPLDQEEVLALLTRFDHALDCTAIAAQADGNPFLALYVATRRSGGAGGHGVGAILFESLADLTADERFLLLLLAVMPDAPDNRELHAALGGDLQRAARTTRSLVEQGLLVIDADRLRFRHALVREAVIETAVPSELTVVHAHVADALTTTGASHRDERAGELAFHMLGCGRSEAAARYAVRGAAHAGRLRAFSEMRSLLLAARRLWPLLEHPDPQTLGTSHVQLLLDAATASRWCGRFDESVELAEEAARVAAEEAGSGESVREALIRAGHAKSRALWAMGRVRETVATEERVAELAAPGETSLGAEVLALLAQAAMSLGQANIAVTYASRAVAFAEASGDELISLGSRITLAVVTAQLGDVEGARRGLEACLPNARRLDDLELVVRCYGNLLYVLGVSGELRALTDRAREALELCARYGPITSIVSTLTGNYVDALFMLGEWQQAETAAQAGLAELAGGVAAAHLRLRLAEIAVVRGDCAAAEQALELVDRAGVDDAYVTLSTTQVRAAHLLAVGRAEEAVRVVMDAWPDICNQDDALLTLALCRTGLRACADAATVAAPLRDSSPLSQHAQQWAQTSAATAAESPLARADAAGCVAEYHRALGQDAAEDWQAVIDAETRLGRPHETSYALYQHGLVLSHARRARDAGLSFARARTVAAELGAGPLLTRIDAAVTALGRPLPEAGRPPAAAARRLSEPGLTRREEQVMALLINGSTNRLIARHLGITERTVSVHVTNILAKLGATNRTQAAHIARSSSSRVTKPAGLDGSGP